MSFYILAKLFASIVTGMLGIPLGILPSIFLFTDLSNGLDDSETAKRRYAWTLWGGMFLAWAATSTIAWHLITILFA